MASSPDLDELAARFRRFGAVECRQESPLYSALSARIAEDRTLLDLASYALATQPVPNMLFGAVQLMLLRRHSDQLAEYYPTLGGHRTGDAFPFFRIFCLAHWDDICEILSSRRVQTNEVGRCAILLPALALIAKETGQPLALIDVGASAGLNLLLDRYRYAYLPGGGAGELTSPVSIDCEVRGPLPVPRSAPPIFSRLGIDLHPLDPRKPDDAWWLRALIWPEMVGRAERLRRALDLARSSPPDVLSADALEVLPGILSHQPPGAAPVVMNSFMANQLTHSERRSLDQILLSAAVDRPIYRLSIEYQGGGFPELRLDRYAAGALERQILGACQAHGRWIEWR